MGRNEIVNDDNPSRPLVLSDGSTFGVEGEGEVVNVVRRDVHGGVTFGVSLARSEAQQFGQMLIAAAFHAESCDS